MCNKAHQKIISYNIRQFIAEIKKSFQRKQTLSGPKNIENF